MRATRCRGWASVTGELSRAQRLIAVARGSSAGDTPLQKVRLSTAPAHILLDGTAGLAAASGLSHQLTTIESIRQLAS